LSDPLSIIRCFAPPSAWTAEHIAIPPEEARHALRARRARPTDHIEVLDGTGRRAVVELVTVGRSCRARIRKLRQEAPPAVELALAVGLPKGERSDGIVEKAVELGIRRLTFFLAERSVPRPDMESRDRRLERWRRIAVETIKQCGRAWLPQIELIETFALLLNEGETDHRRLVGSLAPGARPFREALDAISRPAPPRRVTVFVGPEGDFSPPEYRRLFAAGVEPVTMGPAVLRTDTAAIHAASALALFFESARSPTPSE